MGRHMSEHYCLNQAWIKHTFTPAEGETHSKLQLFLFTSCVSIALYAFVRGKGCVCVEHRGCRWVSKALQLNIRRTMSDEAWLARVRCVCVCACFMLALRFARVFQICLIQGRLSTTFCCMF